jgi:hypothetical protein
MDVHCTSRRPKIDEEVGSTNKLKLIAYCFAPFLLSRMEAIDCSVEGNNQSTSFIVNRSLRSGRGLITAFVDD